MYVCCNLDVELTRNKERKQRKKKKERNKTNESVDMAQKLYSNAPSYLKSFLRVLIPTSPDINIFLVV